MKSGIILLYAVRAARKYYEYRDRAVRAKKKYGNESQTVCRVLWNTISDSAGLGIRKNARVFIKINRIQS